MKVRELLSSLPEPTNDSDRWIVDDPLVQPVGLLETQVLGFLVDTLRSRAAVLLELRQALQPFPVNTGVLVADGVLSSTWEGSKPMRGLLAYPVVDWEVVHEANSMTGRAALVGGRFSLTAHSFWFVMGSVAGLEETVPDYGDYDPRSIRGHVADWDSDFSPLAISKRSGSRSING